MRPAQTVPTTGVRLRLVALPTEHGGWGFLLEPIVLGLALAPSLAGLLLGLTAIGIFLTRHPLTLMLGDWRRGKRYPRTAWAERFVLLYGLTALAAGVAALAVARPFWQALALAVPLAHAQLIFDLRKQSRGLLPEVAGAWALSASAPAITLAAGAPLAPALAIWAVLAARALVSILYVRARLRRLRGVPAHAWPVYTAHL
ncbi:MAG TPA: YwiC-like family protein, partial [Roseiflexaceae bacterium]|nr:YwiC-like family protein [Roseiflexaceae bacterium]